MPVRALALFALLGLTTVSAQDVAAPLTIQGLDQQAAPGARARAMGSVRAAGLTTSAGLFSNPASLAALDQAEVRLGGGLAAQRYSQGQTWVPNRFYLELSLLFENDPTSPNPTKAFDDIRPDWDHDQSSTRPTLGSVAAPLPFAPGGVAITAGVGVAQLANLDHYFQNNNALDPNIGTLRPAPIPRIILEGDSLMVNWTQFIRQREGALYGVTPALALRRGPFTLGASVTVMSGSSDDLQQTLDRGLFTLRDRNQFDLAAPSGGTTTLTGSSDYSGTRFALAGTYDLGALVANAVWQPGYTLDRTWNWSDGTGGTDEVAFPSEVTLGASVSPSSRVRVAGDVSLGSWGEADVLYEGATETVAPWVSGAEFHLGAEFQAFPWLALRGGYHEDARAFAPAGAALLENPARADVFGTGVGLVFGGLAVDLTYELSNLRYRDLWLSNENANQLTTHSVLFEAAYTLPVLAR
ncbi:MAG: hypothetical protein CMM85_04400 [Rhodothermaceae bacterium]|nr:hypothetical protein [Rhodothermaceae bacterium]